MTWAKKGVEFADECARAGLSDAAYRTHDEAIGWLYTVEATNCRIPKRLVRRFAGSLDWETAIKELLEVGFWRVRGDDWEVLHHAAVIRQGIAAQRAKRDRDRAAQRTTRARKKSPGVSADVSADVAAESVPLQTDSQPLKRAGAGGRGKPTRRCSPRT